MATQPPPQPAPPAGPISYHQSWSTSEANTSLKQQLSAFCARAAQIAKENVPPGTNAANGFFRDHMLDDPKLNALSHPSVGAGDADVAAVHQLVIAFEQGVKNAFQPGNHGANAFTSSTLFVQALQTFGQNALAIIKDIVAIYGGNVNLPGIKADVDALIKKIEENGAKFDGTHANGWIDSNMRAAMKTVEDSAKAASAAAKDPDAKKLADFIATVSRKLQEIPHFENDPWLYAEWQVQFGTIMDASAQSLAP